MSSMKRLVSIMLMAAFVVCSTAYANRVISKPVSSVMAKVTQLGKAAIFGALIISSTCTLQSCGEFRLSRDLIVNDADVAKIELLEGIERSEVKAFRRQQEAGKLMASDVHGYTITYEVAGTDGAIGVGLAQKEGDHEQYFVVIDESGHTSIADVADIVSVAVSDDRHVGKIAVTEIKHTQEVWTPNPSHTMLSYNLLDRPNDGLIYSVVVSELSNDLLLVKPTYALWQDDQSIFYFQGQLIPETIFFLVDPKKTTLSDSSILDEKEAEMSGMQSLN